MCLIPYFSQDNFFKSSVTNTTTINCSEILQLLGDFFTEISGDGKHLTDYEDPDVISGLMPSANGKFFEYIVNRFLPELTEQPELSLK